MMKTQSTFSLTCTLLSLICALASLPLNSWSKTGEQENWFLAKEVPLPTGFSPQQYWSDGTNEALLGWSGNKIHKLDFSSKALTFSSSPTILNVDFIGDPNLSSNGFTNLTTKPNGDLLILAGVGQFYLGKWNGHGSPNPGTFSYFTISEPVSPTVKINGDEIPGVLIGGSQITANQSKIAILLGTDMTQYTGENITGIEGDYLIKIFEGNYTDYMGITQQNYFWLKKGNLPEQINGTINNIALTDENQLVVLTTGLAQYFTLQGQFIKKVTISPLDMGRVDYSSQNSQFLVNSQKSPPGAYVYDKQGNFVQFLEELKGAILGMWTQDGHIMGITSSKLQLWKRAYRTKGLSLLPSAFLAPPNATDLWQNLADITPTTPPSAAQRRHSGARQRRAPSNWQAGINYRTGALVIHNGSTYIALKDSPSPNAIPQPVVRSVTQRAGTNILDIDFEIIDSDDATATAGIIASVDGNFDDLTKLIVPSSLAESTENKIGQPIATNQTHRVSWYVKGDWNELTGNLKIGLLARDARRNKAVDLHFLELPFSGGKLIISRSPLKDSDISNFLLFELGRGSTSLSIQYGKIKDANGNTLAEQSGTSIISTQAGRDYFMDALGYRWATIGEVAMAKEAATPGTINEFAATNQVKPRNLPGKVNEYGFDVGNHGARAWWVIKSNEVVMPKFVLQENLTLTGTQENTFLGRVVDITDRTDTAPDGMTVVSSSGKAKEYWDYETYQSGLLYTTRLNWPFAQNNINSRIFEYDGAPLGFGVSSQLNIDDAPTKSISKVEGHSLGLVVGSSQEDAVYIFREFDSGYNGNPDNLTLLRPGNGQSGQRFGATVDLGGTNQGFIAVGAPFSQSNGEDRSGAIYLFESNHPSEGWTEIAKITDPKSRPDGRFGQVFEFGSENLLFVGDSSGPNADGENWGAVYVYKIENKQPTLIQTFTTSNFSDLNYWESGYAGLGSSISVKNDLLAVGCPNHNSPEAVDGGAVVIFKISSDGLITPINKLISPVPASSGWFGMALDLDDSRMIVGAPNEFSGPGIRGGVAYVYKIFSDGRVSLLDRLVHTDNQEKSLFGQAVGINDNIVVIGSPGYDLSETKANVGGLYFYKSAR